jgi:hypothetical protein
VEGFTFAKFYTKFITKGKKKRTLVSFPKREKNNLKNIIIKKTLTFAQFRVSDMFLKRNNERNVSIVPKEKKNQKKHNNKETPYLRSILGSRHVPSKEK